MWFWYALAALLCWSGSDLFSKIGCVDSNDRCSHLKMMTAVGTVMGLHALFEIFINGVEVNLNIVLTYLPVSILYIASMAIGYLGLRYIELSVSSPICNTSGALVAVLTVVVFGISDDITVPALLACAFSIIGVIMLGIFEATEDEDLRRARQEESNHQYVKSFAAIAIPIIYCLLDALGTFADSMVLERLDEDSANCAYELTFFVVGVICAIYVYGVKKEKFRFKEERPRYAGAVFETAGQFFYTYALADSAHVALSAPMISSYCAVSVIWGRIFLKEKLSKKHYTAIAITIIGIIAMGVFDL